MAARPETDVRVTGYLWIFAIFDVGALLLVASELFGRGSWPINAPRFSPLVAIALLIASFICELALTGYVATYQAHPLPFRTGVPLPPIAGAVPHADAVAAIALALAAAQTALLWLLYRNPPSVRELVVGAVVLVAVALCAPLLLSGDVYAYVGDAILGFASYSPPAEPFRGEFSAIDVWWGTPIPRNVYGPLWTAIVWVVCAPLPTLFAKFAAMRMLGAASYGGLLYVLHALRAPRRMLAVAALNPAIFFNYVTNAHNDLIGIVLVLFAALAIRKHPAIAFVLVLAGGLVKLPFAFLALPIVAAIRSTAVRIGWCLAIPIFASGITEAVAGPHLFLAAAPHVRSSGVAALSTLAVALAAAALIALAIFDRRRLRSAVWLLPLTTAFTCPWYLAWSLPYALPRHRVLGYLLVGFPLAAAALDVKFMRPWTLLLVVPLLFGWQALALRGSASVKAPA